MIACYFQYLYCVILLPTQFLQLSPRLEASIVSMRVGFFSFIVCLFAFEISTPLFPIAYLPPLANRTLFNSLQTFQRQRVLLEEERTIASSA